MTPFADGWTRAAASASRRMRFDAPSPLTSARARRKAREPADHRRRPAPLRAPCGSSRRARRMGGNPWRRPARTQRRGMQISLRKGFSNRLRGRTSSSDGPPSMPCPGLTPEAIEGTRDSVASRRREEPTGRGRHGESTARPRREAGAPTLAAIHGKEIDPSRNRSWHCSTPCPIRIPGRRPETTTISPPVPPQQTLGPGPSCRKAARPGREVSPRPHSTEKQHARSRGPGVTFILRGCGQTE